MTSSTPLGIPSTALAAYRKAEQNMTVSDPGCGISWNMLAGIGRIESGHANGGVTDAHGTAVRPIYGPALDGTLPGNEVIVVNNRAGGSTTYARAMGPMQFLPSTWSRYASDGDGDGVADPQNLFDSALAAARYLCSGNLDLRDPSQAMSAILRYNNSVPYARNVLGWAAAYASGVVPADLPPIAGTAPPLGDVHLENPEGLGPGLPLNVHGLSPTDPMAQQPLIDLGQSAISAQQPIRPSQSPIPATPSCTVICIG
jgi:membrane-bound lytic murein transglycosylase B